MEENENKENNQTIEEFILKYSVGINWKDKDFYSKLMSLKKSNFDLPYLYQNEWEEISEVAKKQLEQDEEERKKRKKEELENEYREALLKQFINSEFIGATFEEKMFIKERISEIHAKNLWCYDDLTYFLADGLEGVRKQMPKKSLHNLRIISKYLWAVFKGLIKILILLIIFGIAGFSGDKVISLVIVGLMIIFIQIEGIKYGMSFLYPRVLKGINEEFLRIRKLLNDKISAFQEESELNEQLKILKKQEIKSVIEMFTLGIMDIITIGFLFLTIIS